MVKEFITQTEDQNFCDANPLHASKEPYSGIPESGAFHIVLWLQTTLVPKSILSLAAPARSCLVKVSALKEENAGTVNTLLGSFELPLVKFRVRYN